MRSDTSGRIPYHVGPEEYGGFASPEEQKIYGWLYANYVDKTHAITESEFQAMENVGVNLDAGHAMFRLAKGKHSTLRDGIEYVSISEEDRKRYQGFLPQMWKSRGAKITEVFETELVANTKIKAPGKKETIEIMESAMRKMYGNQYSNDVIHKDVLNNFYAYQGNLANRSWAFGKVFFSELTARGYNATIDFNDAGNLAEKPLILLNGAKSASVKSIRSYSASECKQVFAEVKSPGNYADFSAQKWLVDIPRMQRVSDEFGIKNWLK